MHVKSNEGNRLKKELVVSALLVFVAIGLLVSSAVAFKATSSVSSMNELVSDSKLVIDAEELAAFVDEEIGTELNLSGVPGVAITIVKDDLAVLARGYGFADIETRTLVDVNNTIFRIASVTKLFTWTAVMQLVEQGKLDLDEDVNKYLTTFQIPATYQMPITVANLMAHNAGFDSDEDVGWVADPAQILPLAEYVRRFIPARVRPPGEISVYSNYGASLAGYLVERISGLSFDQYVQTNIVQPLKMNKTYLQQHLPTSLADDLSKSYIFENDVAYPISLGNYMGSPAGAMLSTASDMGAFMIAHLQNGEYSGNRILSSFTTEQMHEQLFTMDPRVPGIAHGFQEYYVNGQRIIGHFGALDAFYSSLMLIPDQGIGWFIVYNGENSAASPGAFLIALMNYLFPSEPYVKPEPTIDFSTRVPQYEGIYRNARIEHSSFYKLVSLNAEFAVTSTSRNTLLVRDAEYVEAEPDLLKPFSSTNPWNDSLVFLQDSAGQSYLSGIGGVYEKVAWFETASFSWSLVFTCSAFFVSMLISQSVGLIIRLKPGKRRSNSRWAKVLSLTTIAYCTLFVFCIVGIRIAAGNSSIWRMVILSGIVGSGFALLSVPFLFSSWKQRFLNLPERLHFTLTLFASLALIWFLNNWNLLQLP